MNKQSIDGHIGLTAIIRTAFLTMVIALLLGSPTDKATAEDFHHPDVQPTIEFRISFYDQSGELVAWDELTGTPYLFMLYQWRCAPGRGGWPSPEFTCDLTILSISRD